jgi:hypothetical protein
MTADQMCEERWSNDCPGRNLAIRSINVQRGLVRTHARSAPTSRVIAARLRGDGSSAGAGPGIGSWAGSIGVLLYAELARGAHAVDREAGTLDAGGEPGELAQGEPRERRPRDDREEGRHDRAHFLRLRVPHRPRPVERDPERERGGDRCEADDRLGGRHQAIRRPADPVLRAVQIGAELVSPACLGAAQALGDRLGLAERLDQE